METNFQKVRQFTAIMGQPMGRKLRAEDMPYPRLSNEDTRDDEVNALFQLRKRLMAEEYMEIVKSDTPENFIKELCDMLYVVYGTGLAFGFDMDEAFNRVHESNMSKLDSNGMPLKREDGKILKGPNYRPAVMGDLV